jgi:TolA-binding protein
MTEWMMTGNLKRIAQQMGIVAAVAGLLAAGPCALAARRQQAPPAPGEAKRFATTDEMKQAQREREEEQREREEEIRDREQEKKEEEQDRAERLQELYDDGREALDDGQYGVAAKKFAELYQLKGPQSDAALYWLAYAENKQGKRAAALAAIADLKKSYQQSRWAKDAAALEMEVRQQSGV